MMKLTPAYPTPEHARAAEAIVDFFAGRTETEAVLLVNSCARGKATRDSCLDIKVLVPEGTETPAIEAVWRAAYETESMYDALRRTGAFSDVHLDVVDGNLELVPHPADEYPDDFEIGVGNLLVYSVPLWERGERLARLKERWLPYYDEQLRRQRLAEVRQCCRDSLHHIPLYVERGLYFQSFARLWAAFRMFLQALFISRRTYPIWYEKWIQEQIVEILGLPELYPHLPRLFEIGCFESDEIVGKARDLERLLEIYAAE